MNRINSRQLNKSQKAALREMVRYVKDSTHRAVRWEIYQSDNGFTSIIVRGLTRSKSAIFRLMCDHSLHCSVGPRGGLKVLSANTNLDSETATRNARKYF